MTEHYFSLVAQFGDPRVKDCYRLTEAFRR
jgi:hypothetical protein